MGSLVSHRLVLSLALVVALSSTQSAEVRSIRLGDRAVSGVLPVQSIGGHNAATRVFSLELSAAQTFTVTVESFEFDCRVTAREPRTKTELADSNSGAHTNAWLVCADAQAGTWRIEVGADDDRGGEFTLSILPQRVDPPKKPTEWAKATIAFCEAGADRALGKSEFERAAQLLGVATQYAYFAGDLGKTRELTGRHAALAREHQLATEIAHADAMLGAVELATNHFDRARELLEAARASAEATLAKDDGTPDEKKHAAAFACFVYDHLGDLETAVVGPASALKYYRKSVETVPKSGNASFEAMAWEKLSAALDKTGDTKAARDALEEALAVAKTTGNAETIASAELSHAQFLQNNGAPEDARNECMRARESELPAPLRLDFLSVETQACIDLARYEQALAAMDEIDELCTQVQFEAPAIANQINRARIAYHVRDLGLARTLLEAVLAHPDGELSEIERIGVLSNLALVDAEGDRFDDAVARFHEAIAACELAGERELQTRIVLDLGVEHARRKDYTSALATFDKGAELAEEHADELGAALARADRAFVLCARGDLAPAHDLAAAAAAKLESMGNIADAIYARDTLARIGLKRGDASEAQAAVDAADALFRRMPAQKLDDFCLAGIRTKFADLGALAQDAVAMRLRCADSSTADRGNLAKAGWRAAGHWKAKVLLDGVRQHNARTAGCSTSPAPDDLEPAIGERTALVEYVDGLDELYAYVVVSEGIQFVRLGAREPVEKQAELFVRTLSAVRDDPAHVIGQAVELYTTLISPVIKLLPDEIKTLVIVPTPRLALLPFDALVPPSSLTSSTDVDYANVRYLIDDYCIVLAPSSPVLAELQHRTREPRPARFLILGDPVYGSEAATPKASMPLADSIALRSSLNDLGRLKSSREEAIEVARLLLAMDRTATVEQSARLLGSIGHRTDTVTTTTFELDLGANVKASALARDLAGYTCIHIAAHAHIDGNDARRSGLVLSYEPTRGGLFSLQDVLALHVDADFVVLSACDTASGPIVRGEGVQSLAYGFLEAGSRAVIAALWRIEDHDAADMMKSFYAGALERGLHPAIALREAKLEFRHSRVARGSLVGVERPPTMIAANPFNWATHVFIGAPPN
jgi:CHAT domain-containing protein/tetratricopeptide (TPR) repeat protein